MNERHLAYLNNFVCANTIVSLSICVYCRIFYGATQQRTHKRLRMMGENSRYLRDDIYSGISHTCEEIKHKSSRFYHFSHFISFWCAADAKCETPRLTHPIDEQRPPQHNHAYASTASAEILIFLNFTHFIFAKYINKTHKERTTDQCAHENISWFMRFPMFLTRMYDEGTSMKIYLIWRNICSFISSMSTAFECTSFADFGEREIGEEACGQQKTIGCRWMMQRTMRNCITKMNGREEKISRSQVKRKKKVMKNRKRLAVAVPFGFVFSFFVATRVRRNNVFRTRFRFALH